MIKNVFPSAYVGIRLRAVCASRLGQDRQGGLSAQLTLEQCTVPRIAYPFNKQRPE
ncbi:hypothetical protein SAMN05216436_11318 [bacterium A37T11]|nr:hypothetical protein SAMN05216436_11318 [bacterium A37T11]